MSTANESDIRYPTPEHVQAVIRAAHAERARVIHGLVVALFRRRKQADDRPAPAGLHPALLA